ncbi:F-box/kelch-repeat protein At3g06240-like [Prosopis cineraria]|uniref:F-box/kelch-repeat protein At3g06240-like n=1 Tax=Prosopis cineraria TaxID=364024 RepID=UPI00240F5837|nr:F-box/kelch-repeat protein At3g06240-like [Prosopis cineraria]
MNSDCLVRLDRYMQELIVYESEVQNAHLIDFFMPVHIVGSSNVLLCLEFSNSILFWNPATRVTRQVPTPINDFKGKLYLGFGFSPIANDYKVVIIYVIQEDEIYRVNEVCVWYGFNGDEDELDGYHLIVSFDIANELFTLVPMPDLEFGAMQELTVFENNLAMLCDMMTEGSEDYEYDCIQLWVMEEATGISGENGAGLTSTLAAPLEAR